MTLDLASRVVAGPAQVSCNLGDEAAILHLTSGTYYSLDPVGARIWSLLEHPIEVRLVRDRLLAEYDVPPDRLEPDLLALLGQLATAALIEVRNQPAA
jgi:hypothetical protein